MTQRYAAVVEAHFHLGELYFVLPFLSQIEYAPGERICLLFTSRRLHEQYLAEPLLVRAVERIGADVVVIPARPERAPGRDAARPSPAHRLLQRLRWPGRRRRIRQLIDRTDLLLTQIAQGYVEQALIGHPRRPRVVRYPHTSAPQIMNVAEASKQTFRQAAPGETILLLDAEAAPYYALYGFPHPVILGYHALTDDWLASVAELAPRSGHAVVYSFAARADILPEPLWNELHRDTYAGIRAVFPDIPIVIKPHPNQDPAMIEALMAADRWEGVELVAENPMLAAHGARLCVSLLTGGIYNAMLFDIPSINFFNAHDAYIRGHGSYMQDFSVFGAAEVRDRAGLERELERIRDGEATMDLGTRKRALPRIGSFAEFRRKLDDSLGA